MTVSQAPDSDGDMKMIDLSGVLALAVSLPECGLTSLECAAAPKCSPLCQRPLTLLTTSHTPLLAVCEITSSVPREQPLSPRASRATRRCNCWSRPLGARTSSQVFAFLSAPADTHMCPLTVPPPVPRSIGNNRIGDEGASALAAILKETQITNLKCAATRQCSLSCQRPLTLTRMPLPLAVSTGTRFRSTSSRAQSRPRRSTSRARGSVLPPPSSSRAASRRTACSRSSSALPPHSVRFRVSAP